jgi:hypothetical protein
MWEKLSAAKGSNPGGVYRHRGDTYYVKFPPAEGQIHSEHAADKIYELMGVESMEHTPITIDGAPGSASKWKEVSPLGGSGWGILTEAQVQQAANAFVASALTKNWDVVGLVFDNMGVTADGNLAIFDTGGSFKYRAMGGPKPFGADPTAELEGMQDPRNPSGQVFGPLVQAHRAKFVEAARTLGGVPDVELMEAARLTRDETAALTVLARKKAILAYFDVS